MTTPTRQLRRVARAAAPDLLAALADLIGCAEPHRDRVEIKAARRAIKKARGEG